MHIRTAIAAIAKNEGAYLAEWIAHHMFMGFDEFHIWVNGTDDNSRVTLDKIRKKFPQVRYFEADELLQKCLAEKRNFQMAAYNRSLNELRRHDFTHMMCLDLDEFYTSSNLKLSIRDVLINNDADVISFQWHMDAADYSVEPFSKAYSREMRLQRDSHVKSIARLASSVYGCDIHTFGLHDGSFVLSNGLTFPRPTPKQTSLVSAEYVENTRNCPDHAYILHRTNRSPIEYLASLLRGYVHAVDIRPIKTNRSGFITTPAREVIARFDDLVIEAYNDHIEGFIDLCEIRDDINTARSHLLARADAVLDMVKNKPGFAEEYKKILSGIDFDNLFVAPS